MDINILLCCFSCFANENFANGSFISTVIGGALAISGGIATQIYISSKERKNKKIELKNEEIRLSNLIIGNYGYFRSYIFHSVTLNYYHQLQIIASNDKNKEHQLFNRDKSYEAQQAVFEFREKLNSSFSEYYKTINSFMSLIGHNDLIEKEMKKIKEFNIGEVSNFMNISSNDIDSKRKDEEERLIDKLSKLENHFNIIRSEILNKIIIE